MAAIRQVLVVLLAPFVAEATRLPVRESGYGHDYGCGCGDLIVPAHLGLFVPAVIIALVAVVRLSGRITPPLPPAALARMPLLRRWRVALAALNARVAEDRRGNGVQRICALFCFVIGFATLLPGCDGPAKLPVGLGYLALFTIMIAPSRRSVRADD